MMENLKLEREQSKDQMSDLVKAIANIPPPVGKSISRFHTRRRTSRLDQQLVSVADKSSDVKRVGQNFRRISHLNLPDCLSLCEDDY
jgi:hypothetical protein